MDSVTLFQVGRVCLVFGIVTLFFALLAFERVAGANGEMSVINRVPGMFSERVLLLAKEIKTSRKIGLVLTVFSFMFFAIFIVINIL